MTKLAPFGVVAHDPVPRPDRQGWDVVGYFEPAALEQEAGAYEEVILVPSGSWEATRAAAAVASTATSLSRAERAFFGVGPVAVAVPLRQLPGRALPVISSEDSRAADQLTQLLTDLAFHVHQVRIPSDGRWTPLGDTVAICGPKSSPVTAEAITSDPFLTFEPDAAGQWAIRERDGSRVYASPMDAPAGTWADVAYVGRLAYPQRELLVVAGVHALGSVGAIDYLARNLPDLYATVGTRRFSAVVYSEHDGDHVTRSELACPPRIHD